MEENCNHADIQVHSGSITNLDEEPSLFKCSGKRKMSEKHVEEKLSEEDYEAIKFIDEEIAAAVLPDDEPSKTCGCSSSTFKLIAGLIIVIVIAVSWTGATQFGKSTYSSNFSAPFFTTWFSTSFMVIVYPVFMIPLACQKTPWRFRTFLRQSSSIFGPRGFCINSLLVYLIKVAIPFLLVWLLTNYLYFRSLEKLLPGTVTAVFSSSSCFVYILSLVFLKDNIYILRIISVLLSVGGIVLMSYSEGFGSSNALGVVFVVLAALGSSFYQVMFKVVMGKSNGSQVALFITVLGIVNIFLLWPVVILMDYFQYEVLQWDTLPWNYLAGTAVLGVVFNYFVNFGISITYPLFISVGTLLGMPLSAAVDTIFRSKRFGYYKIIALFLIVGGFFLMLIPNQKLDETEGRLKCKKQHSVTNEEDISEKYIPKKENETR